MICNFKKYKNYDIFFREDKTILFINEDRSMMCYASTKKFSGDYSRGFHAYSRGAELVGNILLFIDTDKNVVMVDLKASLIDAPNQNKKSWRLDEADVSDVDKKIFQPVKEKVIYQKSAESFYISGDLLFVSTFDGAVH